MCFVLWFERDVCASDQWVPLGDNACDSLVCYLPTVTKIRDPVTLLLDSDAAKGFVSTSFSYASIVGA